MKSSGRCGGEAAKLYDTVSRVTLMPCVQQVASNFFGHDEGELSDMKTSTIFTITGATILTGAVAYAVWFDNKRRNDASFRKQLRTS